MPTILHNLAPIYLAVPWILSHGCLPKGVDLAAILVLALLLNGSEVAKGVHFLLRSHGKSWQLAFAGPLFLSMTYLIYSNRKLFHAGYNLSGVNEDSQTIISKTSFRPLLLPCRTTHTRLFPNKHSFSYSYLFVGIPIGWQGSAGSLLSAERKFSDYQWRRSSWFYIDSADYLERGNSAQGLRGKLDDYLRAQVCKRLVADLPHHNNMYVGSRSFRISYSLPCYRSKIPGLFLQSCVLLVPLYWKKQT